jgi:hypothetical protein
MGTTDVINLTALSSSPVRPHNNDRAPDVGRTVEPLKDSAIHKEPDVPSEDGELPRSVKPTTTPSRKQRKRKKSQQDSVKTKDEDVENGDKRRKRGDEPHEPPRNNSRSPDRTAPKHPLHAMPSESLFFVDDKLADIRESYASTALAGPSSMQRNGGLVLPPHVDVADGSSGTQVPSLPAFSDPEEGEEDFIDYLDVDGDRSVCLLPAEPPPLCTNPKNETLKDRCYSLFP